MAFRIPVIWRDSIPPHEFITYIDPLPKNNEFYFSILERNWKNEKGPVFPDDLSGTCGLDLRCTRLHERNTIKAAAHDRHDDCPCCHAAPRRAIL
jgi:hypothetical protein